MTLLQGRSCLPHLWLQPGCLVDWQRCACTQRTEKNGGMEWKLVFLRNAETPTCKSDHRVKEMEWVTWRHVASKHFTTPSLYLKQSGGSLWCHLDALTKCTCRNRWVIQIFSLDHFPCGVSKQWVISARWVMTLWWHARLHSAFLFMCEAPTSYTFTLWTYHSILEAKTLKRFASPHPVSRYIIFCWDTFYITGDISFITLQCPKWVG